MEALGFSPLDFYYILPELLITGGALLVLVVNVIMPQRQSALLAISLLTLLAGGVALLSLSGVDATASQGLLAIDGFALFFKVIFLVSAALTILMSVKYLQVEDVRAGEYYFLILCATLGMMFMASGVDLITLFIGLETMAISFYILAGYLKPSQRSNEASVKYFLLGAFSLGILLYGMSILYGVTGSTNLGDISAALIAQDRSVALLLAVILLATGMGFKIAAVPFHMWAPDVYEGAPTPVTAFLSVGSKAASFAMLFRIFFEGLPALTPDWQVVFSVLAVVTMTVGNVAAITQTNIKRMLAYSSIAHAGYVLIGFIAASPRGVTAALVYLGVYLFMQLGAFAVITMLRRRDVVGDELKDLSGLYTRAPVAAIAMLLFMLSLGGIPPTAGFMGKFWIFGAAVETGWVWLAVVGVLNSAISLYYYIRVVVFMWIKEEVVGSDLSIQPAMAVTLIVAAVGTVLFGIYPQPLFEQAQAVTGTFTAVVGSISLR
tara:strand:- start:9143 stop:10615 length:1473 start_codon:yes stop_codon:yes gene_type:complete